MSKNKFNMLPLAALISVSVLSGCAATKEANKNYGETNTTASNLFDASRGAISATAAASQSSDPYSNFGHVSRNWVDPNPIKKVAGIKDRSKLSEAFKKNVALTMPGQVSIVEIASELQRSTGISINLSQDIYYNSNGVGKLISGSGGAAGAAGGRPVPVFVSDFVFRGTLEGALDLLSSKANIFWKWEDNVIKVFRFETRSYSIAALAGSTSSKSNVDIKSDGGGNSGGSGGSSQGNSSSGSESTSTSGIDRKSDLTTWKEIETYLLSLLSGSGNLAVLESTGIVTVRDTPIVQERVAKAVQDLNAIISKQIFVNVNIYAVNRSMKDNYGVDWNLVWGNSSRYDFGYKNAGGVGTGGDTNNISIGVTSGPFAGSNVILNALSSLGRASIVNSFSLATLNGQPTPVSNNRKIAYVESISNTARDGAVNPSTTITPGAVYSGVGLTVTPKIQPDNKILMEYSLALNDVERIDSFTSGQGASAQTIQLPTTTIKNILQRAALRSGQTLILSGFKQTVAKNDDKGLGSSSNIYMGGARNATSEEQYLVITITPYLAQDNENSSEIN